MPPTVPASSSAFVPAEITPCLTMSDGKDGEGTAAEGGGRRSGLQPSSHRINCSSSQVRAGCFLAGRQGGCPFYEQAQGPAIGGRRGSAPRRALLPKCRQSVTVRCIANMFRVGPSRPSAVSSRQHADSPWSDSRPSSILQSGPRIQATMQVLKRSLTDRTPVNVTGRRSMAHGPQHLCGRHLAIGRGRTLHL